ncbi:MAG: Coenzyme F420 hydrogenase/dehydrogenase, beta subunit C-terminal domain [Bacteroidales bacterium]|nr:Coenzyme F420 hydrogenase/dehydrogenase, beta subunit C-terminal domain [Bacteroidales bacterium]
MSIVVSDFVNKIVKGKTCTGCGLCVGMDESGESYMEDTKYGPSPVISNNSKISEDLIKACPGYQLNYPELYKKVYNHYPESWLTGIIHQVYQGFSNDEVIRRNGASGGIITNVLTYLLESKKIDAALVVRQGIPFPEKARIIVANTSDEILKASQSVYIPVSTLDILQKLDPGKKYAITCLPDQAAALRQLQVNGNIKALQIKYILGPYTGTALYPSAINYYLKSKGVKKDDKTTSLKWRAGEWPGYLEIKTASGKVFKSKKVYYNFLIPFFVTNTSLQSMDFANEFSDLAVGDAWSDKYEKLGHGFSVVVTRTKKMDDILNEMSDAGLIDLQKKEVEFASSMHGHMIDFKKRGSYIRNKIRRIFGKRAPSFGYKPTRISFSRILVELFISSLFLFGRTTLARMILLVIPEKHLGFIFNNLRLKWKSISKPVKRKSLSDYKVSILRND